MNEAMQMLIEKRLLLSYVKSTPEMKEFINKIDDFINRLHYLEANEIHLLNEAKKQEQLLNKLADDVSVFEEECAFYLNKNADL